MYSFLNDISLYLFCVSKKYLHFKYIFKYKLKEYKYLISFFLNSHSNEVLISNFFMNYIVYLACVSRKSKNRNKKFFWKMQHSIYKFKLLFSKLYYLLLLDICNCITKAFLITGLPNLPGNLEKHTKNLEFDNLGKKKLEKTAI